MLLEPRISIGFLGKMCVILKRKEELVIDHSTLFLKPFVPSYGEILEPLFFSME